MSSASWPTRETYERQVKRALELRTKGMTSPAIARLIGITAKAQRMRFDRHDKRTGGADKPAHDRRSVSEEKRDQAIALLEQGKTLRGIAAELSMSVGCVQSFKDKALGPVLKPKARKAPKAPRAAKKKADPKPAVDPIWTKARQIAAQRRLKKRWCIDHIAADLCQLPGPQVLPRDVIAFARSQRAG